MSAEQEGELTRLLLAWQEARDEGRTLVPELLCAGAPELLEPFRRRIAILERFEQSPETVSSIDVRGEKTHYNIAEAPSTDFTVDSASSFPDIEGYRIESVLGRGGMGIVYLAHHLKLNRLVAIKMILHSEQASAESLTRFLQEAETIAKLRHPNIIQIYDRGMYREQPYFSLEFIAGGSLSTFINGTPQEPHWAADLIIRLADAMQVVHDCGIIHRDLKPGNVLMDRPQGRSDNEASVPKITDFGLARQGDSGMTATGLVMGSPSYMAPEQAEGRGDIGPACDVYSLGAILYECLTGRPPFKGATAIDTVRQVLNRDPVPVRDLVPSVPRDLETICMKCLEKAEVKRYTSAQALADDLRRFREGRPILSRPVRRWEHAIRWARRRPAEAALYITATIAAFLLVGLGVWFSARIGAAQFELEQRNQAIAAAERQVQTEQFFGRMLKMRERSARPAPGWTWANLSDLAEASQYYDAKKYADELTSLAIEAECRPDFRPVRTLLPNVVVSGIVSHPNKRQFAIGERGLVAGFTCNVYLVEPEQPEAVVRTIPLPGRAFWHPAGKGLVPEMLNHLVYTPNGRFLFVATRSGYVHRIDLTKPDAAVQSWRIHQGEIERLEMHPDGDHWYVCFGDRLRAYSLDGVRLAEKQFPSPSTKSLSIHPIDGWVLYSYAGQIHRLAAKSLEPIRPPQPIDASRSFFSPDGRYWLANVAEQAHIWNGSIQQSLFQLKGPDSESLHASPVTQHLFNADGTWLVSSSASNGQMRIWDLVQRQLWRELSFTGRGTSAFSFDNRYLLVTQDKGIECYEIRPRSHESFAVLTAEPIMQATLHPSDQALAGTIERSSRYLDQHGEGLIWQLGTAQPWREWRLFTLDPYFANLDNPFVFDRRGQNLFFYNAHQRTLVRVSYGQHRPAIGRIVPECSQFRTRSDGQLWALFADRLVAMNGETLTDVSWFDNQFSDVLTGRSTIYDYDFFGENIAVVSRDGFLRIVPIQVGRLKSVLQAQISLLPLLALRVLPGDDFSVVLDQKGTLYLVRLSDGAIVDQVAAHDGPAAAIAVNAGGLIVTGGNDGAVRFWGQRDGKLHALLSLRQDRMIKQLMFSTDGTKLYGLLNRESAIRCWHLANWRESLQALGMSVSEDWGVPLPEANPVAPLPPLPSAHPTPQQMGHGLWCETFADMNFERLQQAKIVATVNADWGASGPIREEAEYFSIRYSGWLTPPMAGTYRMRILADNGARLWIDDRLVIDGFFTEFQDKDMEPIQIELSAEPHKVRLDFYEARGNARVHWKWELPRKFTEEVVPERVLTPHKPKP